MQFRLSALGRAGRRVGSGAMGMACRYHQCVLGRCRGHTSASYIQCTFWGLEVTGMQALSQTHFLSELGDSLFGM
jgi:hypothetical protein